MEWDRYKALADAPDVCSRWLLEQTLELLDDTSALAARLVEHLAAAPIEKPADHAGGPETDMFQMSLSLAEVRALREQVEAAAAAGVTTGGTRNRGLNGFTEAWLEYEQFLERRGGEGGR